MLVIYREFIYDLYLHILHVFGDLPATFHPDAQGVVEAAVVDFEFAGPGLVAVAWPFRSVRATIC